MVSMVASLLQPVTDAGVLAQLVVVLTIAAGGLWRVRRSPDLLRLVAGVTVFTLGLFVLRAMH